VAVFFVGPAVYPKIEDDDEGKVSERRDILITLSARARRSVDQSNAERAKHAAE
jgi:hypothetical protein